MLEGKQPNNFYFLKSDYDGLLKKILANIIKTLL